MSHLLKGLRGSTRYLTARALLLLMLLGWSAGSATTASAALIGVGDPANLPFPRILLDQIGTYNFDADTNTFSVDAAPLIYVSGKDSGGCPENANGCFILPPKALQIDIEVDASGALTGGAPGDDLVITGKVTIGLDTYDGVLLTGEIVQFGYEDTNPSPSTSLDAFDFRFQVTGGLLNIDGIFLGQDIGVILGPEFSTFNGSFRSSFNGSQVKGDIFPIPRQCVDIKKQVSVIPLADLKASGELFVDDPTIWFDADTFDTGPGTQLGATYRLVVENCGVVALPKVYLEDVQPSSLPSGFETILFNVEIGELAVGEQKVIVSSLVGDPNVQSNQAGLDFIDGFELLDAPERCMDPAESLPGVPEGKLLNTARASTPGGGKDTDPAWVMCQPDIELKKQVSVIPLADLKASGELFVDDPTIWFDADTFDSGPMTGLGATYRLVVKNTGMVMLTEVRLEDWVPTSLPGPDPNSETIMFGVDIGDLAVGEQKVIVSSKVGSNVQSSIAPDEPVAVLGLEKLDAPERCMDPAVRLPGVPNGKLLNTARVTTKEGPTDENPAWVMCPPDIELKKQVSVIPLADLKASGELFVDDPTIWFDADTFDSGPMTGLGATYRLIVKNTGLVPLTKVRLEDWVPTSLPGPDPNSETIMFGVDIGNLAVGEQKVIVSSKVGSNVQSSIAPDEPVAVLGLEKLDAPERCMDPAVRLPGVPNGKLLNTARVTTEEGPTDENPAWVMCPPDIELKKQVSVIPLADLKASGELFADDPTIWFDADTFDSGPMTGLGATYRLIVKNTGLVPLTNVTLEDVQPSSLPGDLETILFNVDIGDLAVGEQKVIVSSKVGSNVQSSIAPDEPVAVLGLEKLDAPERCLDPAVPLPGVPNDKLLNTVRVTTSEGPTDENPAWVMCQPACKIAVDKTCIIPQPVSTLTAKCSGKIKQFTLTWTHGPVTLTQVGDLTFSKSQVQTGDEITFFNASDDNDVFVQVNGSGFNGQSVFHMSCSDEDMNADNDNKAQPQVMGKSQDCGKLQGNAKHNDDQSFVNKWIFEGLVDADNEVLDCTPPVPGPGEQSCTLIQRIVGCGFDGDELNPDTLTWRYTGGGCGASNNGQIGNTGDWSCNSSPSSIPDPAPSSVTVTDDDGNTFDVPLGGTFTVRRGDSKELTLSASDYSETVTMHTSCSQPLIAGQRFGSLTLAALDGQTAGTEVIYSYEITNLGNTDVQLNSVFDDKLKELLVSSPQLLPAGAAPLVITKPASVDETTTNIVNVYGNVDGFDGAMCDATDTVTVTVEIPPDPPLTGKCSGKLKEVVVYWNGTQTIDVSPGDGADRLSAAQVGPDQPLIIYPDGSTNDVFVNISGAGISGHSKFHVSCSDNDMNADNDNESDGQQQLVGQSQDCGKFQGNAKDNDDASFINTWLLEGMLDADDLRLTCDFDPKTVENSDGVASTLSAGSTGGAVSANAAIELHDDAIKWELTNSGSVDVWITEVEVRWPDGSNEHDKLKEMKLDGAFIKNLFDDSSTTKIIESDTRLEDYGDPDQRVLKKGDHKKLEIKFTEKFKAEDGKDAGDYAIRVKFNNGEQLSYGKF